MVCDWDFHETRSSDWTLPSKSGSLPPRATQPATALAASPWAPLVAVAGQKQISLYNSDNGQLLGVLPFPEGIPHVLKFSRNGQLLLAGGGRGGKSGKVAVWNVLTGKLLIEVGDEHDAVLEVTFGHLLLVECEVVARAGE